MVITQYKLRVQKSWGLSKLAAAKDSQRLSLYYFEMGSRDW
jgi:hypothetical protein